MKVQLLKTPLKLTLPLMLAAALTACSPAAHKAPAHKTASVEAQVSVAASASLGPFDGHINAITFAPVATVPWEGRLVIAPAAGGLKVVDVEGKEGSHWNGPALIALAAVPDYSLRGLKATLVLALDEKGAVRPFIIDDAHGQVIAAPVQGLPQQGASTLCALPAQKDGAANNQNAPQFLIGMADKSLARWQVSDSGAATLRASQNAAGTIAVASGHCAAAGGMLVASGDKGGLYTLAIDKTVRMEAGIESDPGPLAALKTGGKTLVLVADPQNGIIHVYNRALKALYTLSAPKALSTPGAAAPGAMAISDHSFGGTAFSAGLLAVADDSTNRIALVVLDTVPAQAKKPESKAPAANHSGN